ncbi:MAG: CoA-binding protein [Desulfobulbaceae bacterium]|nr:CoA-binding protein [Desulfobulbaceae bacterium]
MLVSLPAIASLLKECKTIAVVGLSPKENRPSNDVARYLLAAGYTVIPVNPGQTEILGQRCYPSLTAIPCPVDLVNIFRRPEDIPPIVDEAIAIKAKAVWMQQGIVNHEAAAKARAAGLFVIMDRCLKVDHATLRGGAH